MLITTAERHPIAIPLNTMTKAESIEDGWIVTDAQGQEHRVDNISYSIAVEMTPASTIQALPRTYLISSSEEPNGEMKVWKTNILGWAVCYDGEIRPLTVDADRSLEKLWQVLHPDGRVERCDGTSCETIESWLCEEQKLCQKEAA